MRPDWTSDEYAEAVAYVFSRDFGASSWGMLREAFTGERERRWWGFSERPYDKHDSAGVEETYRDAPPHLRERMLPRLTWYRAIAAAGWPSKDIPRGAAE